MELQCAQKYTKIIETDMKELIKNHAKALKCYQVVRNFVDEYKKFKKIDKDSDLEKDVVTQVKIADEMIELLPIKI